MHKNTTIRAITNASLALLMTVSHAATATEDRGIGGDNHSSLPGHSSLSEGTNWIHTEVERELRKFQNNMNAYYQRTGNSKRIAIIDEKAEEEATERLEAEKKEAEKIAAEKKAAEEKAKAEKIAAEKREMERLEAVRKETERKEAERQKAEQQLFNMVKQICGYRHQSIDNGTVNAINYYIRTRQITSGNVNAFNNDDTSKDIAVIADFLKSNQNPGDHAIEAHLKKKKEENCIVS